MKPGVIGAVSLIWMVSFACTSPAAERVSVDIAGRPFLGAADAKVTIIEFLDFQ